MLVDRVTELMHVDAVTILLLNPKTNLLEFASGKGFHSNMFQYTRLKLGEGLPAGWPWNEKCFIFLISGRI